MTYNATPGEGGDLERVVTKARLPQKHLETVKLHSPSPPLHLFVHFSSAFIALQQLDESFVTH